MGELAGEKSYSVGLCVQVPPRVGSPVSDDTSCSFSGMGQGWKGEGNTFAKEKLRPLFGREWTGRELFTHLSILNCLHLKITFMPQWHIGGRHILIPFNDCLRLYWVLRCEDQQKLKKEPIYSFIKYVLMRSYQCARHLARS